MPVRAGQPAQVVDALRMGLRAACPASRRGLVARRAGSHQGRRHRKCAAAAGSTLRAHRRVHDEDLKLPAPLRKRGAS